MGKRGTMPETVLVRERLGAATGKGSSAAHTLLCLHHTKNHIGLCMWEVWMTGVRGSQGMAAGLSEEEAREQHIQKESPRPP